MERILHLTLQLQVIRDIRTYQTNPCFMFNSQSH
jgi:hypothetical protein